MRKLNNSSYATLIDTISDELKKFGQLPANCDLAQIGPLHMASLYERSARGSLIRESVFTGMDIDQDIAILKALVECTERMAFVEGSQRRDPVCLSDRSDGFAAYPVGMVGIDGARLCARTNAMAEAVERFSWATWWDNFEISFSAIEGNEIKFTANVAHLLKEIGKIVSVKRCLLVSPTAELGEFRTEIFFLLLDGGGVVSGGACGAQSTTELTRLRALGELSRHAVCVKMLQEGASANTFYERRLAFMATPRAGQLLQNRLAATGTKKIAFPALKIDRELDHKYKNLVVVHRCLFEEQPPFIGGDLDRLCL